MTEPDSVTTPSETLKSDDWRRRYPHIAEVMDQKTPPLTPEQAAKRAERLRAEEERQIEGRKSDARNRMARRLGKRYSPENCNLESFKVYHDKQRVVLDRLRALVPTLPEFVRAGRGLVFYGSVGTGKDHLLAACLYAACNADLACSWINGPELFGTFRDAMGTEQREAAIVETLTRPDVLGVSDPIPPIGDVNAWRIETLYRVLDARYRDGKSTWVSFNTLDPKEADAKLSAPVFDRIRHDAEMFSCFWPSFRERRKDEK